MASIHGLGYNKQNIGSFLLAGSRGERLPGRHPVVIQTCHRPTGRSGNEVEDLSEAGKQKVRRRLTNPSRRADLVSRGSGIYRNAENLAKERIIGDGLPRAGTYTVGCPTPVLERSVLVPLSQPGSGNDPGRPGPPRRYQRCSSLRTKPSGVARDHRGPGASTL